MNLCQDTQKIHQESLLRFPTELVQLRRARRVSQKALALTLVMDPSQLSGLERGSRPPPGQGTLASIAKALSLASEEQRQLEWAARHDRCIRSVLEAASAEDARLVSRVLSTAAVMTAQQRDGLSDYLMRLQSAAQQIHLLTAEKTSSQPQAKRSMT